MVLHVHSEEAVNFYIWRAYLYVDTVGWLYKGGEV